MSIAVVSSVREGTPFSLHRRPLSNTWVVAQTPNLHVWHAKRRAQTCCISRPQRCQKIESYQENVGTRQRTVRFGPTSCTYRQANEISQRSGRKYHPPMCGVFIRLVTISVSDYYQPFIITQEYTTSCGQGWCPWSGTPYVHTTSHEKSFFPQILTSAVERFGAAPVKPLHTMVPMWNAPRTSEPEPGHTIEFHMPAQSEDKWFALCCGPFEETRIHKRICRACPVRWLEESHRGPTGNIVFELTEFCQQQPLGAMKDAGGFPIPTSTTRTCNNGGHAS